ncbi:hypothetical protein, partial [Klebsiella pneumoniae]|uniref:hypothetical protein n=1 Tax=Klebsiella pneumoniae TaxID=573 RepID=UPI003EE131F6
HLSLCTLIAALAITPGCMHTPGKTGNGNDASGAAEPDLLQTLRNRMARGNLLGNKKKAQELANAQKLNAVGADTSRQSAVAAAAASLG